MSNQTTLCLIPSLSWRWSYLSISIEYHVYIRKYLLLKTQGSMLHVHSSRYMPMYVSSLCRVQYITPEPPCMQPREFYLAGEGRGGEGEGGRGRGEELRYMYSIYRLPCEHRLLCTYSSPLLYRLLLIRSVL